MCVEMSFSAIQLAELEKLALGNDQKAVRQLAEYYHQIGNEELAYKYVEKGVVLKEPYCVYRDIVLKAAQLIPYVLNRQDLAVLKDCAEQGVAKAGDLYCAYVAERQLYDLASEARTLAESILATDPKRPAVLLCLGLMAIDPGFGCLDEQQGLKYLIQAGLLGNASAGYEALKRMYNNVYEPDWDRAHAIIEAIRDRIPDFAEFMYIMYEQRTGRFAGFTDDIALKAEKGWRYHALLGAYCNLFGIEQEPNLIKARHYMDLAPALTQLLSVYLECQEVDPHMRAFQIVERLEPLIACKVRYAASTAAALLLGDEDDGDWDKEKILSFIEQAKAECDPMGWALMAYIHHYGKLGFEINDELAIQEGMQAIEVGYCPLAYHVVIAAGDDALRAYIEFKFFRMYYMSKIDAVFPLKEELAMIYDYWRVDQKPEQFAKVEAAFGKRLLVEGCFRRLV